MLNNGITSLTCIHRKAGIKLNAEEKKKQKRRKKGKRIEMESEAIKSRSAAYLLKKWRPPGEKGRKEMRREAVVVRRGERMGGERVVNPMYLISFAVSESSRG